MRADDAAVRESPVILGTGLTGLAISRALASRRIRHVLIGDSPGDKPRLGESLNAEGSLEAARQFPDLARFFFPKRRQTLFFGEHAVAFESIQQHVSPLRYFLFGYPPGGALVHVDRVGFDRALFDSVVDDEHCMRLNGRVASVDYHAASDRIRAVRLAQGETIRSTYVFDATSHLGVVARMAGVKRTALGRTRRVIFSHYRAAPGSAGLRPGGREATSLLRLEAQRDGVDGLAWCIPLGDYASVGISIDPATTSAGAALVLDWLDAAWSRRGLDLRDVFPLRGAPADLRTGHYNHERCSGANWLLAGPTCCQFWFPSSTGVAIGLVAARLAPDVLNAPAQVGRLCQRYLDRVASTHPALEWLAHDDPSAVTTEEVRRRSDALAAESGARLAEYLALWAAPAELAFGAGLIRMWIADRRVLTPVHVHDTPLEAQAQRVFAAAEVPNPWIDRDIDAPLLEPPDALQGPPAVLGVLAVLSGQAEPQTSESFVTPDVKVHIDQFELTGVEPWTAWVSWLRGSRRVHALDFVPGSLSSSRTAWSVTAQWRGRVGGVASVSPPLEMTFEMAEDRITAIRTSRADHTFVLGDAILPAAAFAAMLDGLGAREAAAS